MTTNVVQLDRNAAARRVSAEAHRRYVAERSARELEAIRRNRFARLRSTRRWWLAVLGIGTLASFTAGVGLMHWLSQPAKILSIQNISSASPSVSSVNAVATNMPLITPTIGVQPVLQTVTSSTQLPDSTVLVSMPVSLTSSSLVNLLPDDLKSRTTVTDKVAQVRPVGRPIQVPNNVQKEVVVKTPPVVQLKQVIANPNTQFDSVATSPMPASPAAIVKPPSPIANSQASTTNSVPSTAAYSSVGVPVDGVLQIQIGNDPAIKHYRVGQRLPSGEVLRRATSETGQVETSERSFTVR
jgi:cytoskeletal protein RodZ